MSNNHKDKYEGNNNHKKRKQDEEIDRADEGSFPASDPPPWTVGRRHEKKDEKDKE